MHLLTLTSSICLPSSEALFLTSEIVIALLLLFPVTNTIFRLQSDFSVKYSKFQGGIRPIPRVPFSLAADICQVVCSHFGACVKGSRPVAGGGAGGLEPPQKFSDFFLLKRTAVSGS